MFDLATASGNRKVTASTAHRGVSSALALVPKHTAHTTSPNGGRVAPGSAAALAPPRKSLGCPRRGSVALGGAHSATYSDMDVQCGGGGGGGRSWEPTRELALEQTVASSWSSSGSDSVELPLAVTRGPMLS